MSSYVHYSFVWETLFPVSSITSGAYSLDQKIAQLQVSLLLTFMVLEGTLPAIGEGYHQYYPATDPGIYNSESYTINGCSSGTDVVEVANQPFSDWI